MLKNTLLTASTAALMMLMAPSFAQDKTGDETDVRPVRPHNRSIQQHKPNRSNHRHLHHNRAHVQHVQPDANQGGSDTEPAPDAGGR